MNRPDLDTAAYQAEALAARRRITDTLGEIQDRLDPRTIANQAMDAALDRSAEVARQMRRSVADHAVGVAVVGVGIGLLFGAGRYLQHRKADPMNQYEDEFDDAEHERKRRIADLKQSAGQLRDSVAEKAGAARDAAAQRLAAARDYTTETWGAARERAHEYSERAREGAARARDRTAEGIDHNPLTAALIGAAIGAIVGALLPPTRREDRAFGKSRDRLASTARSAARAAREAGKERFEELGVMDHAKEQLREFRDSASDIARTAGTAAREASKH
jgi:ElaB/YqjD/DUF883 family membrane-anchored ribosome-binding protein